MKKFFTAAMFIWWNRHSGWIPRPLQNCHHVPVHCRGGWTGTFPWVTVLWSTGSSWRHDSVP